MMKYLVRTFLMLVAVCGCFYVCANASNSQNATIEVDSVLRAMYASEPKFEDTEYGRLYTCGFDSVIYRVDLDFRDQGRSVRPVQK